MRLPHTEDPMKPNANPVLALSLVALAFSTCAFGQGPANAPAVPTVPRSDGSGPEVPSMSSAIGDIPTPPPGATVKPSPRSAAPPATNAADLDAAARAAERPGPTTPPALAPAPASSSTSTAKPRPTLPANKGWGLEGSPTVSVTGPASPVSEVLDTTTLTQQIRGLSLASRGDFLTSLEKRIEGTDRDLNEVRQTSRHLQGNARAAYLAADDEMKGKHRALKKSLKEARAASPENWVKVRDTLATDYEAYSVALVQMEASSAVGR